MTSLALMLTFAASVAWCAHALARAKHPAWCLAALPTLVGSWVLLLTLRLPPSPELALLAFTLADLAVLVIAVLGVVRLMGGFEPAAADEDDAGDDDGEPPAPDPVPRSPSTRRPRPHPARRRPGAPRPPRPRRGDRISA